MASVRVLAVQNDPTDPPSLVGEWLAQADVEVVVLPAFAGEPVPVRVPADIDGILVLGGAMAAWEDEIAPWLPATRALLRDAQQRGIPVLGLCLGGQLLAMAAGGRVAGAEAAEVGVTRFARTAAGDADPVLGAAGADREGWLAAAQWHQDRITDLPAGAVLLAGNEACPVQAFRLGGGGYGVQFHPEVDADVVASWVVAADPALARAGRSGPDVVADVGAALPDLIRTWRPMTHAWAGLVHAAATERRQLVAGDA